MARTADLDLQYKTIGNALLSYEQVAAFSIFSNFIDARAFESFRASVALLPNAILESYLDDMLGEKILDEQLYIKNSYLNKNKVFEVLSLFGVFGSVAVGTQLSFGGMDPWWSLCVSLGLGSPCAMFFYAASNRRLRFARVVSFELSRRRGDIEHNVPGNKLSIRDMLSPIGAIPSQKVGMQ